MKIKKIMKKRLAILMICTMCMLLACQRDKGGESTKSGLEMQSSETDGLGIGITSFSFPLRFIKF